MSTRLICVGLIFPNVGYKTDRTSTVDIAGMVLQRKCPFVK